MPFLPLQPCYFQGQILPGTPKGIIESPTSTRTNSRYHAQPKDRMVDEHVAVVLYYDAFGFKIVRLFLLYELVSISDGNDQPNPQITADAFADHLGLSVFVPDYIRQYLKPPDILCADPNIYSGSALAGMG